MFAGLSLTELLLILAVLLLLCGARRVPQLARSLGKGLGKVRRVKDEIEEGVGISQLRQAKQELVQEVKKAAGSVTEVVVDLKDSGEGKAKPGENVNV